MASSVVVLKLGVSDWCSSCKVVSVENHGGQTCVAATQSAVIPVALLQCLCCVGGACNPNFCNVISWFRRRWWCLLCSYYWALLLRWWLFIVPPVWIIVLGLFVPRVDILITVLCAFVDVVHWDSAVLHCVAWLSTLVANDLSLSLSCWLAVWLSFSFGMLSFERHSLSNLCFSFCWAWSVISLLMLTVAPVTFAVVALLAFVLSFSFMFSLADCSYVPVPVLLHCSLLKLLMMGSVVACWR